MNPAPANSACQVTPHTRRRSYLVILLLFVLTRAAFFLAAETVASLRENQQVMQGLPAQAWIRWDANWFLRIIGQGYSTDEQPEQPGALNYAFFPVYPALVKALMVVSGLSAPWSALLVANGLLLVALFLIHAYALALGWSPREAQLTTAFILLAPQAYMFSTAYSESTFLLLLAAAMLAWRKDRFLLAAAAAAFLSATRPPGLLLAVFFVQQLVQRHGWAGALRFWRQPVQYLPLAALPLGLFGYMWFAYLRTGDAFIHSTVVAHGWGYEPDWPWRNAWAHLTSGDPARIFLFSLSALYAVGALLLLRHGLHGEFCLVAVSLFLYWSGGKAGSLVRYCLTFFPMFMVLARTLEPRTAGLAVVFGLMGLVNGVMLVAWMMGWTVSI